MLKRLNIVLIINLFLIFSVIQGCRNKNHNENDKPQELIFKVNQSLLGENVLDKDYGYSFSPPKGCLQMPKEMVQKVKDRLQKEYTVTNSFIIEPYKFFLDEGTQFACLISILPTLSHIDSVITKYQEAIYNHTEDNQITQTVFLHNGFRIYQSLIMNKDIIQFKLVVPQPLNRSFQIDYVIPQAIYREKVEAIESSIGALSKL